MSENYGSIGDSGSQLARMQNGMAAREDRQIVKVGLTSERPIIGLTDNRLYRQADNLSVSADRQFCLSAIDRYTWIRPITIESANISSYRHILVSIVPISHQDY